MRHLSDSHDLLLNKFNVVAHHLICVTRTFQPQTDPLDAADLGATWEAMQVSILTLLYRLLRCVSHDFALTSCFKYKY